jgi:hypothetical protein
MPVLNATTEFAGWVSIYPRPVSIKTNDNQATILGAGYLNSYVQLVGQVFSNEQMALVETTENSGVSYNLGWYQISISGANTSLVPAPGGSVILPVVDHHIATFDGTTGAIADQTGTAIQKGSIQAGLSGTAGSLISFPGTASSGSLIVAAVANVGNKTTTISSVAGLGQNEVITIPDAGAATANFIISASGGTQHITAGALQVDAGVISSGISTGGTAGGFIAYPATASNGSFRFVPVGNAGNFAVTVSPISSQGQATVMTIPDVGAATGQFVVKTAAFVSGNLIQASGTGGLTIDSGIAASNVQLKANIIAQQSANIGGGGAGPIDITVAGATSSSVAVATVLSSSNAVSVLKVLPGSGKISVTFSGDPGASAIINYVVFIAAQ